MGLSRIKKTLVNKKLWESNVEINVSSLKFVTQEVVCATQRTYMNFWIEFVFPEAA